MERIQSAIEKARARRQGKRESPLGGGPRGPRGPKGKAYRPQDAAREAGELRVLWQNIAGFTPDPKLLERQRIFTLKGGGLAVPFDIMRTKVLQQMRNHGWRRLAITSPTGNCGKTTVAVNLAFSLARQADLRTALVELDLHRPSLAETLGLGYGTEQFSDVLAGRSDIDKHLRRFGKNLVFCPSRKPVRDSTELLQSASALAALDDLESRFWLDLMVFDMPPMRGGDDMLGFAQQVDCVLLIAAAETTTIAEIDACERELAEQTNVLGVVLNKCRYPDTGPRYTSYD